MAAGTDFAKADAVRRSLGLDDLTVDVPPEFDDPALSRRVLGLPA